MNIQSALEIISLMLGSGHAICYVSNKRRMMDYIV